MAVCCQKCCGAQHRYNSGGVIGGIVASFTESIVLICLEIVPCLVVYVLLNRKQSIVPGGIFYFAIAYLTTLETHGCMP